MPVSTEYFNKIKDFDPALRDALLGLVEEIDRSREESVTRDDFRELRDAIRELAEAQQRTETRVEALAEAQQHTYQALRTLTEEHRKTRRQVGGLSATVGYRLEDEAFMGLPPLLERDFGLTLDSPLKRRFVQDKDGKQVEVNEFVKKKLFRFSGVFEAILPVLVTYMISEPDAEEYARQKGIALYYSYEIQLPRA